MSKHWKEPYTIEAARSAGIHGSENCLILGDTNAPWIYYVDVCSFRFVFFSLGMIRDYIDFYQRKILPTSRFSGASPFSDGPAASIGDGQSPFERLPGYLRKGSKRLTVVKALERALAEFERENGR